MWKPSASVSAKPLRLWQRASRKRLWQIGGVPEQHRTDHLECGGAPTCAKRSGRIGPNAIRPSWRTTACSPPGTIPAVAHENGDVEQSHHRFKQAVDQALRARGSRDFANRAAYEHFLQDLVRNRNQTRARALPLKQEALRPLPATPLAPCKELRVTVSRFSTIHVLEQYLLGSLSPDWDQRSLVRVRAETLEGLCGHLAWCLSCHV